MKARIRGIKVYTFKFSYCFGMHLAYLILSHTDSLSQTLQGTQMTAVDVQVVSRACVTTIESIRSENEFNLFWSKVKQFAEKHKIDEPHLPHRKNIPNRYMIGKAAGKHPENVEEVYQRQYYAALDNVITCIKERFEQKDYEMYATLEQLLIKAIFCESFEELLQKVIGFYHDHFNDDILRVQLRILPAVIGQDEGSVNAIHDIRVLVKQLKKPIRNLISEVVKMIKLVIVMPATNSISECFFSAMRRLYIYLRTNMGSNHLKNAMVLHIHKDRLDQLSMVDVANDFAFKSDHRKTLFERSDDVDLRRKSFPVKSVRIQANINN